MRDGAPQNPQPLTARYKPFRSIRWFSNFSAHDCQRLLLESMRGQVLQGA